VHDSGGVLISLALILLTAKLAGLLSRRAGLPSVFGKLLVGLALGRRCCASSSRTALRRWRIGSPAALRRRAGATWWRCGARPGGVLTALGGAAARPAPPV
jgi:Kef-type K+ transport system membrane component KefB